MVHRFDLRNDRGRTGAKIGCSLCGHQDKFLLGALYWFSQDKRVRLIGHCCAKKHDAENFENANNALTYEDRYRNACNFLENNLQHVPLLLGEVSKLEPLCEQIMHGRNQLKMMRGFLTEMQKALRNGGKLNVEVFQYNSEIHDLLKSEGAIDKSDYIVQTIHVLEGKEYFEPRFNPLEAYNCIITFFQGLALQAADSYDAMLLELIDDKDATIKLAAGYRRTVTDLRRLHQFLQNASRFLSESNLTGLKNFGANRHTSFPFGLTFNDRIARFESRDRKAAYDLERGRTVPPLSLPDTI